MGHGEGYENSEDQGSRSPSDAKLEYENGSLNGELGVGDDE